MKIHMVGDKIFLDIKPAELAILIAIMGKMVPSKLKSEMYLRLSSFFVEVFASGDFHKADLPAFSEAIHVGEALDITLHEGKLQDILYNAGIHMDFFVDDDQTEDEE